MGVTVLFGLMIPILSISAVNLPAPAQKILDMRYPGWTLAPTAPAIEQWFQQDRMPWAPSLVVADFNGDGKKDYAVRLLHGGRQVVAALVSDGSSFVLTELAKDARDPFTYLVWYKKGEKDFDFENMKPFRYANDSFGILYFHQTAVTFTWKNGQFEKREAPGDEEVEAAREAK